MRQRVRNTKSRWAILVGGLAVAVLAAGASPSRAEGVNGVDVDIAYWAGTGSNQAVLVVDFLATGGGTYAFGYRWSGTATGYDMVEAVAGAGALEAPATYYPGMGYFIDNFSYYGEHGDPNNYWAYWLGTAHDGTIAWAMASGGPGDRTLADGSFDGWYNGFDDTKPRVPMAPEPATAMLAALALVTLRRRSHHDGMMSLRVHPKTRVGPASSRSDFRVLGCTLRGR